jgi:hypothetical protein
MSEHVQLNGEYLDAAVELRAIAVEKKDLATREAECKRVIEAYLNIGERGVTPDGEEIITVRAGARRFDAAMAAENLPKEVLAQITTLQWTRSGPSRSSPPRSTTSAARRTGRQ